MRVVASRNSNMHHCRRVQDKMILLSSCNKCCYDMFDFSLKICLFYGVEAPSLPRLGNVAQTFHANIAEGDRREIDVLLGCSFTK